MDESARREPGAERIVVLMFVSGRATCCGHIEAGMNAHWHQWKQHGRTYTAVEPCAVHQVEVEVKRCVAGQPRGRKECLEGIAELERL